MYVSQMKNGRVIEEIYARGHENITAMHRTTLEITKDSEITPRGDCIIGVNANKSVKDLSAEIKKRIWDGCDILIELSLPEYGIELSFSAKGDRNLSLSHEKDIVIRKSRFKCDRTLCIESQISAKDIDREFVKLLKDRKTELIMRIYA